MEIPGTGPAAQQMTAGEAYVVSGFNLRRSGYFDSRFGVVDS